MISNIFVSLVISSILILLFYWFRNEYTLRRQQEAIALCYTYTQNLLDKLTNEQLIILTSQWDDMIIDYDTYLHNLFLWGKYSAINPKYKNLLVKKE